MKRLSKENIGKIAAFILLLSYSSTLSAQTYNHESAIMNQFTVMEIGSGSLTPREYYNLNHKNYQREASLNNKQSFRTKTQEKMMKEISLAENVDSVLSRRAKVEAMNIANRTPGVADVAWKMEKGKIEGAMSNFQRNINKITLYGGTSDDYKDWSNVYHSLAFAIKVTRESYMDLGSRKREYLTIYRDIVKKNLTLTKQLRALNAVKTIKEVNGKATKVDRITSNATVATDALGRWQQSLAVNGFHKKN